MVAKINSTGPITIASTTIATLGWSLSPEIAKAAQMHSGLPYPTAEVISGGSPRVNFKAYFQDIHALTGLTILSATTFNVYLSAYTSLIRDASSIHLKLALATSCVAAIQITGVSTDQDGILIADVEAVLLANDSTTHPFAITTNNALPALTAEPVKHTLGPLVVDSTGIPGVQSASLGLAPNLQVSRSDGDLYPRVAAQTQGQPVLNVGHKDPRQLASTIGLVGLTSSSVVQYFRRYDATTGLAGASNGVSFTIGSARITPMDWQTEPGAIASQGLEIRAMSSSTTHPVVVSTSASVPAAG